MKLKEFLHEQKLERKAMRAERKASKKYPKTTREKIYKIAGILFLIFVVAGCLIYSCSGMPSGYDWNSIIGITDEVKDKLEKTFDLNLILEENEKIIDSDLTSLTYKFSSAGVDFEDYNSEQTPTKTISLNSREVGAMTNKITKEINSEQKYSILSLKFYYDIANDCIFQKSVAKVDLGKYFDSTLPIIYITCKSKCEIQNKNLTILNYSAKINDFNEDESDEIFQILNKNTSLVDFKKIINNDIAVIVNLINNLFKTTLTLESDNISFCI